MAQDAALSVVGYLEICSVIGGTVRGDRSGFDTGPSNTVVCPDPDPPAGFSCRIVVQGAQAYTYSARTMQAPRGR